MSEKVTSDVMRTEASSGSEDQIAINKETTVEIGAVAASPEHRDVCHVAIRDLLVQVKPPRASLRAKFTKDVEAQQQPKVILNNISLDIPGGSLTAIMGSSGSGKTSLLNAMSRRVRGKVLQQTGTIASIRPNTKSQDRTSLNVGAAYVMQQDALQATLTVRETLRYAADLRLSTTLSKAERWAKVETVITDLGLQDCADTRIGNDVRRGCSGGEKRRTSIGVQLLADQVLLLADEPSTGLDSTSAMGVIRCLKGLADKGYTIIITVHQPRSEIWDLIDNVVLLARGDVVYSGSRSACLQYFESLGHNLPAFVNPFDFIIDVASVDVRSEELEKVSKSRVNGLHAAWRQTSPSRSQPLPDSFGQITAFKPRVVGFNQTVSYHTQRIGVHSKRNWVTAIRDRLGLLAAIVEAVGVGIASGWIFNDVGSDLTGIRSRQGSFFITIVLQPYLIILFETYRLTLEIPIFDRELSEGVTSPTAFIISRRLSRFLLEDVPVPLINSTIFYFMAGFRADAAQFLIFYGLAALLHQLSVAVALFCVAANRHFMVASLIANSMFTIQSFGSGFIINTRTISIWLRWIKWIVYSYYGYAALAANEFTDQFYDCPIPDGRDDPRCIEYTGSYIIASLNLPQNWLVTPIAALVGFLGLMLVADGLLLTLITHDIEVKRVDTDDTTFPTVSTEESKDDLRPITVSLEAFQLSVTTKRLFRQNLTKQILHPLTATFEPGVLNVIMGPSGSGKSSLLNAIANRLHASTSTTYERSGRILLNGAVPSREVTKSVISYVHQDDVGLLPALTVRETLRYAAQLRLPHWMTTEEKLLRAEDVLLKLGLKDCADTLIGNALMKGISGGEKRRVSIALQILTSPNVLICDEPTSGLDSFTAASIIEVLQGLANEGRTVVLTIHQPRSDLYKHFGSMLLLAKGGHVVYAGQASSMVPYFDNLGYKCPEHANPADFTLDLISTSWTERRSVSDEKLTGLIQKWTFAQQQADTEAREIESPAALGSFARTRTPFRIAFPLLMQRNFKNVRRQPEILTGRISQFIAFGVILLMFYTPMKNDFYSVQSRVGYATQLGSLMFVGMLNSIATYPPERDIFYHEDDDGIYPLEAFFLQFSAFETPNIVIGSLLFSILAVFPAGLHRTARMVFVAAYAGFAVASCGESLGIIFFSLFSHLGLAINVGTVVMSLCMPMGGVMAVNVTGFLQWINHINPVKWQVNLLILESLRGVSFTCEDFQRLANGDCPIETGEQVVALYKLDKFSSAECAGFLAILVVFLRILAYVVLKLRRTHWTRK